MEKFYLHIASAVIIGLLGWQATTSAENKNETIKLNGTMINMIENVGDIKFNQRALISKVGGIEKKVSKMCDRQNLYWQGHKIPCE